MTTVSDLTERDLIARIRARLDSSTPDWLLVGIGDDAAVVEAERNRLEVLTVDAIVDGVHFDRRFTPPNAIGHRALAVNLSDLAAMGASPRLALLSMALPAQLPVEDLEGIVDGLAVLARRHRVHVVGGNLTRTPGPLVIDMTLIGSAKRRQTLLRTGARPGDEVYVSGSIGGAAAGLQMLRQDDAGLRDQICVDRYLRPEPRLRLGTLLARNRAASACMDLSDGLADGVTQIAEASGVGIAIDSDSLPVEPAAREWFANHQTLGQTSLLGHVLPALTGGDDYELLFTARPRLRGRLKHVQRHSDVPVTRIGVCTADRRVVLTAGESDTLIETPMPAGFSHF